MLWRETLTADAEAAGVVPGQRRTTVVVGGRDCVVNADAVASYVYYGDVNYSVADREEWKGATRRWAGTGDMELIYLDGMDHGQGFLKESTMPVIERVVETYAAKGGKESVDDSIGMDGLADAEGISF